MNWVSWLHLTDTLVADDDAAVDICICLGRDADCNRTARPDYLARKDMLGINILWFQYFYDSIAKFVHGGRVSVELFWVGSDPSLP